MKIMDTIDTNDIIVAILIGIATVVIVKTPMSPDNVVVYVLFETMLFFIIALLLAKLFDQIVLSLMHKSNRKQFERKIERVKSHFPCEPVITSLIEKSEEKKKEQEKLQKERDSQNEKERKRERIKPLKQMVAQILFDYLIYNTKQMGDGIMSFSESDIILPSMIKRMIFIAKGQFVRVRISYGGYFEGQEEKEVCFELYLKKFPRNYKSFDPTLADINCIVEGNQPIEDHTFNFPFNFEQFMILMEKLFVHEVINPATNAIRFFQTLLPQGKIIDQN